MAHFDTTVTDSVVKTVTKEYRRLLKRDSSNLMNDPAADKSLDSSSSSVRQSLNFDASILSQSDSSSYFEDSLHKERSVRKELVNAKAKIASLEHTNIQLETSNKKARVEYEQQSTEKTLLHDSDKVKLKEIERKVLSLERERNKLRDKIAETEEQAELNYLNLESRLRKKETKCLELEKEKSTLLSKINNLEEKLVVLAKDNQSLESKLNVSENNNDTNKILLEDALEYEKANKKLREQILEMQSKLADSEKRLYDQQKLIVDYEDDAAIVRMNKKKLDSIPRLEREARKYKEELEKATSFSENINLLREQLNSEQIKSKRLEERCKQLGVIEVEFENLKKQMHYGGSHKVMELERQLQAERTAHQLLLAQKGELSSSLSSLEGKLEHERKEYSEIKDTVIRQDNVNKELNDRLKRLKIRLEMAIKERDAQVALVDSFKAQLDITVCDGAEELPVERRLKEMEKLSAEYKTALENIQRQLDEKCTELSEQKTVSHRLNAKLKRLNKQMNNTLSSPVTPSGDRQMLDHLRNQLQTVQGELDKCKREKQAAAKELGLQAEGLDLSESKVIHLKDNPLSKKWENINAELARLHTENQRLFERVQLLEEGHSFADITARAEENASSVKELTEQIIGMKSTLKCEHIKYKRLEEQAQKTIKELKMIYFELTGWKLYEPERKVYKVVNDLAVCSEHFLYFKRTEKEEGGHLILLKNSYSEMESLKQHRQKYLENYGSISAFLAAITLDLNTIQHNDSTLMTND
ncbi:DgyrCDS12236 [Dimorphilus gyrociliatus]|uniref:DgyrCDS12236 n=1 Tax=Dimorphilus gyrociliatus TaxID=2664684 RepID=A0A7I8W5U0_9ANNE|nr:DgyrCDS12236 [Dimorphilus gyrociliatus]